MKPAGPEREGAAGAQEGLDARVGESHPGDAGAGGADDRAGDCFQRGGSVGGVVADAFGVQQAPVGGVADLGHGGEVSQLFADAEVARLVQRGFRSECSSFLQVLFDLGLLVIQVEVGAGPGGDDLGPEGPWGGVLAAQADLAVEDDVDLVRPADVDVVADQLLEGDPAGGGPVQRHGGGELGLLDRQLPAVIRLFIFAGERVRQPGQPLAGEPVDRPLRHADRAYRDALTDLARQASLAALRHLQLSPAVTTSLSSAVTHAAT